MAATTLHAECPTCGGDGMHPITKRAVSSFRARKCDDCGGTGRVDSPAALERLAKLAAIERLVREPRIEPADLTLCRIRDVFAGIY